MGAQVMSAVEGAFKLRMKHIEAKFGDSTSREAYMAAMDSAIEVLEGNTRAQLKVRPATMQEPGPANMRRLHAFLVRTSLC